MEIAQPETETEDAVEESPQVADSEVPETETQETDEIVPSDDTEAENLKFHHWNLGLLRKSMTS